MKKVLLYIDEHLEEIFCLLVFVLMSLLTFVQVILRYIFNSSIVFSEELSRYLFVWLTFIGISYGVKKGSHLSVDVVFNRLKGPARIAVNVLAMALYIFFAVLMVVHSYKYFARVAATAQLAASMNLHMKWVALAPLAGFVLVLYRLLQQSAVGIINFIKNRGEKNG